VNAAAAALTATRVSVHLEYSNAPLPRSAQTLLLQTESIRNHIRTHVAAEIGGSNGSANEILAGHHAAGNASSAAVAVAESDDLQISVEVNNGTGRLRLCSAALLEFLALEAVMICKLALCAVCSTSRRAAA